MSVIKHPEIFERKNCLQTQISLLKIAPGMTLMSDGVKWCKKQSLFVSLYYKGCMGCCYNSHLYGCLPAGPYICYRQWMSMLLEGKMFALRLWQDRFLTRRTKAAQVRWWGVEGHWRWLIPNVLQYWRSRRRGRRCQQGAVARGSPGYQRASASSLLCGHNCLSYPSITPGTCFH